jgi:hypothetical protein
MPDITLHFRATGKYPLSNPPTLNLARALERSMTAFGIDQAAVASDTPSTSEIEEAGMAWATEDLKQNDRIFDGDTVDMQPEQEARVKLLHLCVKKMAGGGK